MCAYVTGVRRENVLKKKAPTGRYAHGAYPAGHEARERRVNLLFALGILVMYLLNHDLLRPSP